MKDWLAVRSETDPLTGSRLVTSTGQTLPTERVSDKRLFVQLVVESFTGTRLEFVVPGDDARLHVAITQDGKPSFNRQYLEVLSIPTGRGSHRVALKHQTAPSTTNTDTLEDVLAKFDSLAFK